MPGAQQNASGTLPRSKLQGYESSSGDESVTSSLSEASVSELAKRGVGFHLGGRQEPSTVQKKSLSPLEVRFSQLKMRHLFGDGRRVADAVPLIRAERCTPEETAEHGGVWRLEAPFPVIEVIRWRCKLRDETTGRAKVDPSTGADMLDSEERWFALDNRRLYCLQEVAQRLWPERCVVDMHEVLSGPHLRIRGLRKFRTLDVGKSVVCGTRADGVPTIRWSWREQAGISEAGGESDPDTAKATGKAVSPSGRSPVLAHLASLKEGDYDRIERSKKLSWVLRRGAETFNIPMDDDGWVRVNDLLQLEFLGCDTAEKFFGVVEDSNKQKRRYELKDSETGVFEIFIRASRPSKLVAREQARLREQQYADRENRHSAAAPAVAAPIGSFPRDGPVGYQGAGGGGAIGQGEDRRHSAKGRDGKGGKDGKGKGVKAAGSKAATDAKGAPALQAAGSKAATDAKGAPALQAKDEAPRPAATTSDAKAKAPAENAGGRGRGEKGAAAGRGGIGAAPAAASASAAAAPAPPAYPDPVTVAALAAYAAGGAMPKQPGAAKGKAQKGAGGAGKRGAAAAAAAPNYLQALQQMQHIHNMHAVFSQYQLHLRQQLMQLGQMQQLQNLQALAHMQQLQNAVAQQLGEMEANGVTEYGYDEEDTAAAAVAAAASVSASGAYEEEAAAGIEAKIAQAREAASHRSGPQPPPQNPHLQAKIAEAREAARERNEFTAKIAEAREAARGRSESTNTPAAETPWARSPDLIVKIAEARESAKQRSHTDVEARIAEVLAAARQRNGAAS